MNAEREASPSRPQNSQESTSLPADRPSWGIYRGTGIPRPSVEVTDGWPPPPPWRSFGGGPLNGPASHEEDESARRLGEAVAERPYPAHSSEVAAVNAALALRRPLLVTGQPGVGKSSLAYRISRELGLGRVLRWPITSRVTLRSGLYDYDAIGRAQHAGLRERWYREMDGSTTRSAEDVETAMTTDVGDYIQLGPLGTALLPYAMPRVLLVDELDKSDIDLPNDLLHVFEEGEYFIRELDRIRARAPEIVVHTADPGVTAVIKGGNVRCHAFPIVIITSNGERDFPPAFLRRCLQMEVPPPTQEQLAAMVAAQLSGRLSDQESSWLIKRFLARRDQRHGLGVDQLLNAVHLASSGAHRADRSWEELLDLVWRYLNDSALP